MISKSIADEYCNAHMDASCLPSIFILPSSCITDQDCRHLQSGKITRPFCQDGKCKFSLVCPLGFFSWNGGCLPYSTNNQKCPGGSEQCIQGLLCVDGTCIGTCHDGEILIDGKCVSHGNLGCIDRDCASEGCPSSYPICTHKEASDSYHCCKKKGKKSGRPNRHIDLGHFEKDEYTPDLRYKPRNTDVLKLGGIPKSRRRIPPSTSQIPQPGRASQRAISVISTVTSAPLVSYVTPRSIYGACIPFAEVQIGSLCYAKVQVGASCVYSAQCPSRTSINGQPPYLCINGICQLSVVCSPGYFSYNNTCLKYSASGQTCSTTTTQCLAGSTCINGECYSGCGYNQLLIENVCVGYADYGCILRSCESDGCPSDYSVCTYLRTENAYVCCNQQIETALLCPNTGVRPQLAFGSNIPIDCVARQCARGYTCTHVIVSGSSRYICCPKINALVNSTSSYPASLFNPLHGYLSVCLKSSIRQGCTPVSQQLCFCYYQRTTPNYESTLPTFTTAFPNITTTTAVTTTTTTTTAAPTVNQTCDFGDIVLTNGTLAGETVTVPDGIIVVDGANQMTVVCDATAFPGATVFMEFNGEIGGPTAGDTAIVEATLVCIDGAWTYTQDGFTTTITEVACFSNATDTPVTTCTQGDVDLIPGTLPGEIPTTPGVDIIDGVAYMTVTCSTGDPAAITYMAFNNFVGGPSVNFLPTVSATLVCSNGNWEYTENGVTTIVNDVQCIQGTNRRRLQYTVESG